MRMSCLVVCLLLLSGCTVRLSPGDHPAPVAGRFVFNVVASLMPGSVYAKRPVFVFDAVASAATAVTDPTIVYVNPY